MVPLAPPSSSRADFTGHRAAPSTLLEALQDEVIKRDLNGLNWDLTNWFYCRLRCWLLAKLSWTMREST